MKKIIFLLLLFCLHKAISQPNQINIVNFTVKNVLPGNVDNWINTPGAMLLTVQKGPQAREMKPFMVFHLRNGGSVICGNTPATAISVEPFDVRTFNTSELIAFLTGCKELKEGTYSLCVQFFSAERKELSREVCKEFTVEARKTDFSPPQNISPTDKKDFTEIELKAPLTFRWTPLVPKPKEPVTYRLRVWQLIQGQNAATALRNNEPIVVKDVENLSQTIVTGILTGPCKPPYMCDFIWTVQALNREGKPMGINNTSEPFTFNTKTETNICASPLLPQDKKKFSLKNPITFKWTKSDAGTTTNYRLRVWQLMEGQTGTQAMKSNQPIITKEVGNANEIILSGLISDPCKPPYMCDFVWAVEMMDANGTINCTSEPFTFSINSEAGSGITNQYPENKKTFSLEAANGTVRFGWTPIVPQLKEPVTYRLRVWQLMQGQNRTQAMKANQPIVTKEVVNNNEASVSGIFSGSCKHPYLCDFIWNVQALNREGKPLGENNGTSESTLFSVNQYIIQLDSIKVLCTNTPGVYSFSYTVTNPNLGPATLSIFTVTSSAPAGAGLGSFIPPINTLINSGNQLTLTGTINAAPNLSNICIGAEIKDVGNAFWKASKDTCINVVPCRCEACDEKNFIFTAPKPLISFANNTLSFNQSVSVITSPVKTVKSITAEMAYFEMVPESNLCIPCNKDASTYGHFTNSTNSLQWNGSQSSLKINITTPQLVPCCSATFRWCIRYKIEFTDCTSCSVLVCYDKRKEGCDNPTNDNNYSDPK